MTLTLRRMSAGLAILFAILAADIFLLGNQRLAHAEVPPDLGSRIVCGVFTDLNHVGEPIPVLSAGDCQNPPSAPPQCSDGIDNDDDGLKDFPADPGCSSSLDTDESNSSPPPGTENTLALCSDGVDNDADGKTDLADSDCSSFAAKLVVVKIVINDNGGTSTVSDFSLHVATSTGLAETIRVSSGATTTVPSGTWTVGEIQKPGYTATFGGDCNASGQVTLGAGETKTCTISNNDIAPGAFACADGMDNDGDGLIDSADPGCNDSSDNDETNASPPSSGGGGGGGGIGVGFVASAASSPATQGIVLGVSTDTPPVAANESCDKYLTAFIKSGAKNDQNQVRRLQYVLRDFEGGKISVNGIYDAATLVAVRALQIKYAGDILTPWGITKSTGFVYLTTRKKINEIYCRSTKQFPLTSQEQQTIHKTRSTAQPLAPASSNEKAGVPTETPQSAAVTEIVTEKKGFWERILDIVRGVDNR